MVIELEVGRGEPHCYGCRRRQPRTIRLPGRVQVAGIFCSTECLVRGLGQLFELAAVDWCDRCQQWESRNDRDHAVGLDRLKLRRLTAMPVDVEVIEPSESEAGRREQAALVAMFMVSRLVALFQSLPEGFAELVLAEYADMVARGRAIVPPEHLGSRKAWAPAVGLSPNEVED